MARSASVPDERPSDEGTGGVMSGTAQGPGAPADSAMLDGRGVWFSTRRGFRFGVVGMPEDHGILDARGEHVRFIGRRLEFALERPARMSLVHEPPGLAPLGGIAVMAIVLLVAGLPTVPVLVTLAVLVILLGGHALASRWVRLEQHDADGGTTVGYLTDAGFGRYGSSPRTLLRALESRVPSPVRAL